MYTKLKDVFLYLTRFSSSNSTAPTNGKKRKWDNGPQEETSACELCEKIVEQFSTPLDEEARVTIGNTASLLEGGCPHVGLFRALKEMGASGPTGSRPDVVVYEHEENELLLVNEVNRTSLKLDLLCRRTVVGKPFSYCSSFTGDFELIRKLDVPGHPGRGRLINRRWIDENVVRGWISSCEKLHGENCERLPLFSQEIDIRPLFLIDTVQRCLIRSNENTTDYVALSYVWGSTETLRNNMSLCEKLQQPGVLDEEFSGLIPATIRDAISVVGLLGKRYLWVDALCIVQDDIQQLNYELSQMHRIYACASFTIIAADGRDASYGLRGFKNLTLPRYRQQGLVSLGNAETLMPDVPGLGKKDAKLVRGTSRYHDRAWTFQEYLFSKRRLIFLEGGVRWECQCSRWEEDLLPNETTDKRRADHVEALIYDPIPTLKNLTSIIREYNYRETTFPEDIFSAFLGVETILHRTYPSGFLYGLPELFFDIALTWRPPSWRFGPSVTRRMGRTISQPNIFQPRLPSWSWLGWTGRLEFPSDHELNPDPKNAIDMEGYTSPVTDWYTGESPNSPRRRINSSWHLYKERSQNEDLPLPTGWSREEYVIKRKCRPKHPFSTNISNAKESPLQRYSPRPVPKHSYTHPAMPSTSSLFLYPIPIPATDSNATPEIIPQTSFLFARTSRAYLLAQKREQNSLCEWSVDLLDKNKQPIGYIRLNNNEEFLEVQEEIERDGSKKFEVVATCNGYSSEMSRYAGCLEGCWDCVFVLWVEWIEGVATRRGYGAVGAREWEVERAVEDVDLVLG